MYNKALILGGTGAMGEALVQILTDKQYDIYVTSRRSHDTEKSNLHFLVGNAHKKAFLESILCERFDVIVDFMKYDSLEEFRNLLYIKLNTTNQYIFFSSATIYTDTEDELHEGSAVFSDMSDEWKDKRNQYAVNKILQEQELHNSGYHNWTIIRPYITYNVERLQLGVFEKESWLYRALHKRTIVVPKSIMANLTTMTYGYDVALAIEQLIGNEKAMGEVVQITTEECVSWEQVLNIYLSVLEEKLLYRPDILLVDDVFMLSPDREQDRRFNNKKLKGLCDVSFIKTEKGLRKCLSRFIEEKREFREILWTKEAVMDALTNEVAILEEIPAARDRFNYMMMRFAGYQISELAIKDDNLLKWQEWMKEVAGEDYLHMRLIFENKKQIGIYAVSNMTRRMISAYDIMNADKADNKRIVIYDSSEKKQGTFVGKYRVQKPIASELAKLDVLIISSDRYYNEIYSQYIYLESQGIEIVAAKDILKNWEESD